MDCVLLRKDFLLWLAVNNDIISTVITFTQKQRLQMNYISERTLESQERKKKRHLVAGFIITGFLAFGVVDDLTDSITKAIDNIWIYVIILVPGLFLLWSGFRCGKLNDSARRYATIFETDRDGVVTMEELTIQTNKNANKIISELEVLFSNGYFESCKLQKGDNPCVILSGTAVGEVSSGFIDVKCPDCGALNRIRAGSRSQCIYCGSSVEDKGAAEQ